MNEINNENKIDKSVRNSEQFQDALARAICGEFDKEISDKPEGFGRLPLLKVHEQFSLRKGFCLETGNDYFQLMKEVFYIENPGSNYFETVSPTVYRRVAKQHESGDLDWAKRVAKHYDLPVAEFEGEVIEVEEPKKKTKTTAKKTTTKKEAKKADKKD